MNFEIHHGGNSLNNVANLHVIMAIRNCEFFEVLLPAEAQKYGLVAGHRGGLARHGARAHRARAWAPQIDFALIERKKLGRPALRFLDRPKAGLRDKRLRGISECSPLFREFYDLSGPA